MNWHFFGLFRFLFSSNEIKYPFRLWTSTQFFILLIFFSSSFKLIHFFLPDWIYSFRFSQCGIAEFRFSLVELHVLFSCFCSVFSLHESSRFVFEIWTATFRRVPPLDLLFELNCIFRFSSTFFVESLKEHSTSNSQLFSQVLSAYKLSEFGRMVYALKIEEIRFSYGLHKSFNFDKCLTFSHNQRLSKKV